MDRIYFVGNPWPNGHRIEKFEWGAHFKYEEDEEWQGEVGLYFDLHLETADYDEEDSDTEDEDEVEEGSDWESKIVWNNYHSCTLSSEEWNDKGFCVGTDQAPFDCEQLNGIEFLVDHLSSNELEDMEHTAFDVYLLGHDASAFHTIKFTRQNDRTYHIDWKGKLALAYAGDYECRYQFYAQLSAVTFRGIDIPSDLEDEEAWVLLRRFVKQPEQFKLTSGANGKRFVGVL